jgi:hypothetical protein
MRARQRSPRIVFSEGSNETMLRACGILLDEAIARPVLVGSEADLEQIAFAPGSAELDAVGRQKLSDLASALAQRPGLTLGVAGHYDPAPDRQALQEVALQQELTARGLAPGDFALRNREWEEAVEALFSEREGADYEELPPPANQYDVLRGQIPVPPAQLDELAKQRAIEAKRFLVSDAGVLAERVVLRKPGAQEISGGLAGVEMKVDI